MATTGHLQICLLFTLLSSCGTLGWIPVIFRGSPTGGMVGPPQPSGPGNASVPVELWFDLQLVNHFNAADQRMWSQRYFINGDRYEPGGPIFLMLSGEAEADPALVTLWRLDRVRQNPPRLSYNFGASILWKESTFGVAI
ncbi:hypothetical protein CHS0354_034975 [Potamilus streckersoni]|uniref:Uncharacterized protein n=1 Tax=Potamilus streckersoni TaxID=2493646 RepID=A0AAE0SE00_9BIVA|nr:hypothetical protein CHS0354_034975 [Potamilus streckersoni]